MDLSDLESKVEELIARCETLAKQNLELREREQSWQAERAELVERHQVAQAKIDSMIGRATALQEG